MQAKKELGILDPPERLKVLANYSSAFEVDPKVPTKRYYRSGVEMLKMGQVYLDEGSLENAYVLYMKYMTLFLEKIRQHPEYASVPTDIKIKNHAKIREILPKCEKIKALLLEQYTKEYNKYMEEKKREKEEEERQQKEEKPPDVIPEPCQDPPSWAVVQPAPNLDNISYPQIPCVAPKPDDGIYPLGIFDKDKKKDKKDKDKKEEELPANGSGTVTDKPSVDRSSKPSDTNIALKKGLRNVVIPSKVTTNFLNLSYKNTMNNIETCGILAGKLEKNQLIITHVIIPNQKGTSDSCTMLNEEDVFDYQDAQNLITIGWIHTHPTQTAFLSSVDLHTHCPYQLLMPEAIAIVCAPRYNETGVFVLTPGYGLQFVANCTKSGFHPHPTDPPLFMQAEHIRMDNSAPLEVLDLRPTGPITGPLCKNY